MAQLYNIAKAWVKVLNGVTTEEEKRRAKICKTCEFSKYNKGLAWINDELEEVKGLYCTACGGCPIIAKVRSEETCEKNKW